MSRKDARDIAETKRELKRFLRGGTDQRVFSAPTGHPSRPTGFCYCDGGLLRMIWVYLRAVLQALVMKTPFNRLKIWWLRQLGTRIGKNVFISVGVFIDPLYPQLLTIEDDVFIGMDARIFTHEFRIREFRVGKVIIRRGAFIGGYSLIACGVEIGEEAMVGGATVVPLDVPPGTTASGNPAFITKRRMPEAKEG